MNEPIQIYEHGILRIGFDGFHKEHFNLLIQHNEQHNNNLYTVGYNKIKFSSYVGVIQVKDLIIEVLPKGDRSANGQSKKKWRNALLIMLAESKKLHLKSISKALLRLQSHSLLDLYIEHFLNEVEQILHKGLIKKYRLDEGQLRSLKGRLHLPKHLAKNYVHKERLYTVHQKYDYNHALNQILKIALKLLTRVNLSTTLEGRTKNLLLRMEQVHSIPVKQISFNKIQFSRRTNHYKEAIYLARLIIKELSPQLSQGKNHVLAFLFDMNKLFEEFIYRRLKRQERAFSNIKLSIRSQRSKYFWQSKTIRPDIILSYDYNGGTETCVIDTKWKLLQNPIPGDDDLKQMFTYNLYFDSQRSILLYPSPGIDGSGFKTFKETPTLPEHQHGIEVKFISPFTDNGEIDPHFAKEFLLDVIIENREISNSILRN